MTIPLEIGLTSAALLALLARVLQNALAPNAATTAALLEQLAGLAAEIHALSLTYLPTAEDVVRLVLFARVNTRQLLLARAARLPALPPSALWLLSSLSTATAQNETNVWNKK